MSTIKDIIDIKNSLHHKAKKHKIIELCISELIKFAEIPSPFSRSNTYKLTMNIILSNPSQIDKQTNIYDL